MMRHHAHTKTNPTNSIVSNCSKTIAGTKVETYFWSKKKVETYYNFKKEGECHLEATRALSRRFLLHTFAHHWNSPKFFFGFPWTSLSLSLAFAHLKKCPPVFVFSFVSLLTNFFFFKNVKFQTYNLFHPFHKIRCFKKKLFHKDSLFVFSTKIVIFKKITHLYSPRLRRYVPCRCCMEKGDGNLRCGRNLQRTELHFTPNHPVSSSLYIISPYSWSPCGAFCSHDGCVVEHSIPYRLLWFFSPHLSIEDKGIKTGAVWHYVWHLSPLSFIWYNLFLLCTSVTKHWGRRSGKVGSLMCWCTSYGVKHPF